MMLLMFPLIWKSLARRHALWLFSSLSLFIGMLLILRMHEILSFAALGTPLSLVSLFALYQIPYILPYAIALSSGLAAFMLARNLSRTSELVALRSAGIGIREVIFPILISTAIMAMGNFLIISELTPHTRRLSQELLYKAADANPLVVLKKNSLLHMDGASIEGGDGTPFTCVMRNEEKGGLTLLLADSIAVEGGSLVGENVSLLSRIDNAPDMAFDTMLIENQARLELDRALLSHMIAPKQPYLLVEHTPSKFLFGSSSQVRPQKGRLALFEVARRLFFPCATLSLTLLGFIYGISIGRRGSIVSSLCAAGLGIAMLLAFVIGKSYKQTPWVGGIAFFLPHCVIIVASLVRARSITRGRAS